MNNILILSATSDMAKACAHVYAKAGYPLILAGRNLQALEPIAQDLRIRYQHNVHCIEFDVCATEQHLTLIQHITTLGELEGVLCFTGYLGEQQKAQQNFAEARHIIDCNFAGLVSMLELLAAHFEQKQHGFIVGVSSVAGERGRQSNYIYGASKAAFTAYLSGLRNRLFKSGVSVLTVKPGFVATRMTEHLELNPVLTAQPEQVAAAIFKAQQGGKPVLYVKPVWALIMWIIRALPETLFKRTNL